MLLCFPVYDSFLCLSIRVWGHIEAVKDNIAITVLDMMRYDEKYDKKQAESYKINRITKLITELMAKQPCVA